MLSWVFNYAYVGGVVRPLSRVERSSFHEREGAVAPMEDSPSPGAIVDLIAECCFVRLCAQLLLFMHFFYMDNFGKKKSSKPKSKAL